MKVAWTRLEVLKVTRSTYLEIGAGRICCMEKDIATHSTVLAWRIPGMGEPGGLPSMGSHRVRHDLSDLAAVAVPNQIKSNPL